MSWVQILTDYHSILTINGHAAVMQIEKIGAYKRTASYWQQALPAVCQLDWKKYKFQFITTANYNQQCIDSLWCMNEHMKRIQYLKCGQAVKNLMHGTPLDWIIPSREEYWRKERNLIPLYFVIICASPEKKWFLWILLCKQTWQHRMPQNFQGK